MQTELETWKKYIWEYRSFLNKGRDFDQRAEMERIHKSPGFAEMVKNPPIDSVELLVEWLEEDKPLWSVDGLSYYYDFDDFTDANGRVCCGDNTFEVVDAHGGEGMGDEYWCVIKHTQGEKETYYRRNGWYQSYNGNEWHDLEEVTPKEVVKTEWNKK